MPECKNVSGGVDVAIVGNTVPTADPFCCERFEDGQEMAGACESCNAPSNPVPQHKDADKLMRLISWKNGHVNEGALTTDIGL